MGRTRYALLTGTLLLAGSALVHAQNAYTSRPANVRAGPDRSYPLVAQLAPGTPVDIDGCLDDWSWCDVGFDDTHGWVYSPSLAYDYQGSRVPFYTYAPSFGLPIITFSLGSYWDRYYRGRPWFAQRRDWDRRHIPHRRPPGPPPRSSPPPRGAGGFRPQPGGAGPTFRPRGDTRVPERREPARAAPERAPPERTVPQREPRENGNFARPNTGRQITPRPGRQITPPRQAPQRGASPGRDAQRGEPGRGGERPQSGRGDNRGDHRRGEEPPH